MLTSHFLRMGYVVGWKMRDLAHGIEMARPNITSMKRAPAGNCVHDITVSVHAGEWSSIFSMQFLREASRRIFHTRLGGWDRDDARADAEQRSDDDASGVERRSSRQLACELAAGLSMTETLRMTMRHLLAL